MIRVEDLGELAYGGIVTGLAKWDASRMLKGQLTSKDILKKAETWGYVVPGIAAVAAAAMDFGGNRMNAWTERIAHGFIYDFPRFVVGVMDSLKTTATTSNAVAEAQRIVNEQARQRALAAGNPINRSTVPTFEKVGTW